MKTVLIFRGLARGRRQTLIDEMVRYLDIRNYTQINTPQPREKVSKEEMKKLSEASFEEFKRAISAGTERIIINNSNLKKYHYFQYLDYAQRHNYQVGVIIVPWKDLTYRELAIDSGNVTPEAVFKRHDKEFTWEM